jgi:K+-transporting ATPase KdpF subunit
VTADDVVGLILSVAILAYLVYALVFPERLG